MSELSVRTGVPVSTIHHYRQRGLAAATARRRRASAALRRRARTGAPADPAAARAAQPVAPGDRRDPSPSARQRAGGVPPGDVGQPADGARPAPTPRWPRIVDVTISELAGRSLDEVTVGDVCVAAGIGKGTFYRYFDSKESAFIAAARTAADRVAQRGHGRRRRDCGAARASRRARAGVAARARAGDERVTRQATVSQRRPGDPRSHRRGARCHARRRDHRRDALRGGSNRPGHRHLWARSLKFHCPLVQDSRPTGPHCWTNPPGGRWESGRHLSQPWRQARVDWRRTRTSRWRRDCSPGANETTSSRCTASPGWPTTSATRAPATGWRSSIGWSTSSTWPSLGRRPTRCSFASSRRSEACGLDRQPFVDLIDANRQDQSVASLRDVERPPRLLRAVGEPGRPARAGRVRRRHGRAHPLVRRRLLGPAGRRAPPGRRRGCASRPHLPAGGGPGAPRVHRRRPDRTHRRTCAAGGGCRAGRPRPSAPRFRSTAGAITARSPAVGRRRLLRRRARHARRHRRGRPRRAAHAHPPAIAPDSSATRSPSPRDGGTGQGDRDGHDHRRGLRPLLGGDVVPGEELRLRHPPPPAPEAQRDGRAVRPGQAHRRHRRRRRRAGREGAAARRRARRPA